MSAAGAAAARMATVGRASGAVVRDAESLGDLAERSNVPTVYLHPGQLHAAAGRGLITTLLGSCVSVCLFDPIRGVGGANHFLLPHYASGAHASPRYGPPAIYALLDRLLRLGAERTRLEAKVFGGACVLEGMRAGPRQLGVSNVEVARAVLGQEGIPVRAEDVGGTLGRKVVFRVHDGAAWVKVIRGEETK
jgi:chemotaxis protein CheD